MVWAAWCSAGLVGQTGLGPADALRALQEGNRRFARDEARPRPQDEGLRRTLQTRQGPVAIVVTCADSRVAPEHVFDADLGDLFVVRNAGNVCDPESLASIEHAASRLGAPLCVVMAHSHCEAVRAADTGGPASAAQGRLAERLEPALRRARAEALAGPELIERAARENAHETAAECLRRSPVLRELARQGALRVVAAHYDLASGVVEWLPERPVHAARTEAVPHVAVPGLPPHVALEMLRAGHRRFLAGATPRAELGAARREQLVHGQRPFAVVLACADARVGPELVFDAGLGGLFVVRVAGNVLGEEALGSIEHALASTGAGAVVVMGHRGCSAVAAALEHPRDPHASASMRELVRRLEPAVVAARHEGHDDDALRARAEELNVLRVLTELRDRSALARRLEEQGRLALVPVLYRLDTGDVTWLREPPQPAPPPGPPGGTEQHRRAAEPADPPAHGVPGVVFEEPVAEHVAEHAAEPPARHPQRAAPPPEDPELRLRTLLIAFMVATSGVGTLLLLQRRLARA